MDFQVFSIDHDRPFFAVVGSQADQNPGKDAFVTPSLPTIVQRFQGFRGPLGAAVPLNCVVHISWVHCANVTRCG